MRFGSVCSGIEAASVAWHPLGWEAAWLSEIEPFPCAVLKHHYPDVPNYGDMTLLPDRILSGEVEAPDLFCGGTPCQAFSVAGLRNSLDDARGNLSLTFVGIANAIDHVRSIRRDAPAIIFWENVPGVLNTKDNAFGCFLGALAGESDPVIAPGDKWSNAGCVYGPQRTVAWRVLDAQYFGVAQRRRRVFVVASARDDFDPTEVLFEFEGVRRDIAPRRESRESSAASTERGTASGKSTFGTLMANVGTKLWLGNQEALSGDYHVLEPIAFENSRRDGVRLYDNVSNTLQAFAGTGGGNGPMVSQPTYALQGNMIGRNDKAGPQGDGINVEVCFTQNTTDRHAVATPIAFPANLSGTQHASTEDLSPSMGAKNPMAVAQPYSIMPMNSGKDYKARETNVAQPIMAGGPVGGNQSGDYIVQPIAFQLSGDRDNPSVSVSEDKAFCIPANPMSDRGQAVAHLIGVDIFNGAFSGEVAVPLTNRSDGTGTGPTVMQPISFEPGKLKRLGYGNAEPGLAHALRAEAGDNQVAIATSMAVRRLTPTECERLQGFPDGYTNIPWRGKAESPDGPRYKALGNSWAVPVVRWIGKRIQERITT